MRINKADPIPLSGELCVSGDQGLFEGGLEGGVWSCWQ